MTLKRLLLVFLAVGTCLSYDIPSAVVTNSGKIRGHYLTSYQGNKYEAYQGIPYAEPPIGIRRFEPPVPIQPWSYELNATELKSRCPQKLPVVGSEDCLYLNIYVPTTRQTNESLPVIFFIHGGSFKEGGAKESMEYYIIDYDVIFVSIQYRLGILGFLSTEDDAIPGNMGLKDQSVALRWIHENIKNFGGDSQRITLIGESSGAANVHHHYLSPWSTGLFHAGLSLSGTSFAPWSMAQRSRDKFFELCDISACNKSAIRQAIDCLQAVNVDKLIKYSAEIPSLQYQPGVPFGPVVEKSSENPFISDHPSRIINEGRAYDVPWITGVVSDEGIFPIAKYAFNAALKKLDDNWLKIAPILLDYYYTIPEEQRNNVSQIIRKHYFGDKPINKENFRLLTNLVSDRLFKVSAAEAAKKQAAVNKSPVFFYEYNYRATDSTSNRFLNSSENLGVCHGDDVGLVLKKSFITPTKSMTDMAMQRRLIQLWTSVARYGVPKIDVEWLKVSRNNTTLNYLQIDDPNDLAMKNSDNFSQTMFWKSIAFDEWQI